MVNRALVADGRGEVKDHLGTLSGVCYGGFVTDVAFDEPHGPVIPDVTPVTGGKIVEHRDCAAIGEQSIHQVRTDEPRPSGDEDLHAAMRPDGLPTTI